MGRVLCRLYHVRCDALGGLGWVLFRRAAEQSFRGNMATLTGVVSIARKQRRRLPKVPSLQFTILVSTDRSRPTRVEEKQRG